MQLVTNDALDIVLEGVQTGNVSVPVSPLKLGKIGLYTTDLDLGRTTTLAALAAVEATFPGYARHAITWNAPSRSSTGTIESLGTDASLEFRPSNDTFGGQNVYGIFVTRGDDSTQLAFCARFDNAPRAMADTHSSLVVTISWAPTSGGYVYTDL